MRRNYGCDSLELYLIQLALDHVQSHLEEAKSGESDDCFVTPFQGRINRMSEIEMRLEATNNLISALASAEDLTLKIN